MGPRPKWKPRRTLIDLYNERDHTRWYWRAAAIASAGAIMIGYLIFPSAFNDSSNVTVKPSSATVIASILLATGYALSFALWFICHSSLFRLDTIFAPCLTSSVLGLFNTAYALTTRHSTSTQLGVSSLAALIVSTLFTVFYTILTVHTAIKVDRVRSRDTSHRNRTDSESINLLPEDEQQRQQLLRLLMAREGKKTSPDASTFRIDLPDSLKRSGTTTYLQAPQHAYEARQGRSLSVGRSPTPERFSFSTNAIREVNNTPDSSYPQPGLSPPLLQSYSSESTPRITHSYPNASASPVPDIIQPPYADRLSPEPPAFATPSYSPLDTSQSPIHTTTSYPPEKVAQQLSPLHDVHPLERRNRYQVVGSTTASSMSQERNTYRRIDLPAPDEESTYRMMDEPTEEERKRSASRESRRREIERGGSSAGNSKVAEGVEVVPRIVRVETDGFGRV